jgi:alpha-1,3-rhamnosyl/mannosyltransferase
LRLATLLAVPSEAVRIELSTYFGVPRSRIRTIPLAAAEPFRPGSAAEVTGWLREAGLESPYLVALSDAQPRKNLHTLLEAWELVKAAHPSLQLVLAGAAYGPCEEPHRKTGLRFLGNLDDQGLRNLLSAAVAFVYPSLYEGFGLPVLEAMQTGVPVIASRDRAVSEVTGGAALLVDTLSVDQLRQAIANVVTCGPLRSELKAKGLNRSALYSWRSTAWLTRQTYVEAIGRF